MARAGTHATFASACTALPCSTSSVEYMLVDSRSTQAALVCDANKIFNYKFYHSFICLFEMQLRSEWHAAQHPPERWRDP